MILRVHKQLYVEVVDQVFKRFFHEAHDHTDFIHTCRAKLADQALDQYFTANR